ncbi:hypothetical protein ACC685_38115, partial [Rhizobium ruizarguesonis]
PKISRRGLTESRTDFLDSCGVSRTASKLVNAPQIKPVDKDVLAAFESVKLHPEFVLSRRELIR